MTVLLDTSTLRAGTRQAAVAASLSETAAPLDAVLSGPTADAYFRVEHWTVGEVGLFYASSSGFRLTRNVNHIRNSSAEFVTFGFQISGHGRHRQGESTARHGPGELTVLDFSLPWDSTQDGPGTLGSLQIPRVELGAGRDVIACAAAGLARSPIHDLFSDHLRTLPALARYLPPSATHGLGRATVELARALLDTINDTPLANSTDWNQALPTLVQTYVDSHLTDPGLCAATVARAHHISVRYLYRIWTSVSHLGLNEWIIQHRLQGARDELARCGEATVATVAHHWAFSDSTHFSRRFRGAYGMSPSEWRVVATADGSVDLHKQTALLQAAS